MEKGPNGRHLAAVGHQTGAVVRSARNMQAHRSTFDWLISFRRVSIDLNIVAISDSKKEAAFEPKCSTRDMIVAL